MRCRRMGVFFIVFLCLSALALFCGTRQEQAPAAAGVRMFFTVRSAKPDDSLGDAIRKAFENDKGGPFKSVSVDLRGDGKEEKFVLDSEPSDSGGLQWLILDPAKGSSLGLIVGTIIFIERQTDDGFPRLETYWKQGEDMAVVFDYSFSRGKYVRVDSRSLTVPEINDYFRAKPSLDPDKELVEIKDDHDATERPRS
jgi:hypothetical protein